MFAKFCHNIGYNFTNQSLLEEALTHPSLSKSKIKKPNYQRLEFLGDKVLSLVIADFLMQKHQNEDEGHLSRRQADLVSGETLWQIALKIGVEKVLQISSGEEKLGGKTNKRNLENALEALIGAIYLDSGYQQAKEFIMNFWAEFLEKNITAPKDPVSELQEFVQLNFKQLPKYHTVKSGGTDHDPVFISVLTIPNMEIKLQALGKSKKEAQKEVAKAALQHLLTN